MAAVRALLIGLHLVSVVAVACPAPVRTMSKEAWERPAVRDELEGWSRRLGIVGVTMSPAALQDISVTVQGQWLKGRNAVVWPFRTWLQTVNAPQGWYMFTGPDRDPQRFVLTFTSTSSPEEQLVFEAGGRPARRDLLDGDFLDDHRVRRAMFQSSWGRSEHTFRAICDGLAARVRARATPADDVDNVHCRLVGRRVVHPWNRGLERPERVVRELVLHRDGSAIERKDDGPPRKRVRRQPGQRAPTAARTPATTLTPSPTPGLVP